MPLCFFDPGVIFTALSGQFLINEFGGLLAVSIYDQIQSDILSQGTVGISWYATCKYRVFIRVTSFDESSVSLFGGSVPRAKFGSYILQNADYNLDNVFINYTNTVTDNYYTLVTEAPRPESVTFEACETLEESGTVVGLFPNFQLAADYKYVNDIIFDPAQTVSLEGFVVYTGYCYRDVTTFPQPIFYQNF